MLIGVVGGLIKAASSFAFSRHTKVGTMASIGPDVEDMKVNRQDFLSALDEVKPLFGVSAFSIFSFWDLHFILLSCSRYLLCI